MSYPLADEWNEYKTQVLPTFSADPEEVRVAFLGGAASMLVSLHETIMERPDQINEVFLEYSSEIRTLLGLRPRKGK